MASPDPLAATGAVAHDLLVVEDDQETAAALKELLELHGFQVRLATDGGQAHASIAMREPDFVILDLILPGESGFEVCDHIKRFHESIPVLIVSAIDMDDSRDLAERVGADGYLTKPYDPNRLIQEIRQIAEDVWAKTHLGEPRPRQKERIRLTCTCGKRFKVSPVHRGRTMTCSACGETLVVPVHN